MKLSEYKSYDDLPLFLNAEMVAKVLGVSPSSGYELLHEDGFPVRSHHVRPMLRYIGPGGGMLVNTVRKYVLALEERGLIVTEPTDVRLKSGRRRNGNLKYTLPSIQEVLRDYYARQRSTLEAQTERQRVQKMLAEQQAEDSL